MMRANLPSLRRFGAAITALMILFGRIFLPCMRYCSPTHPLWHDMFEPLERGSGPAACASYLHLTNQTWTLRNCGARNFATSGYTALSATCSLAQLYLAVSLAGSAKGEAEDLVWRVALMTHAGAQSAFPIILKQRVCGCGAPFLALQHHH